MESAVEGRGSVPDMVVGPCDWVRCYSRFGCYSWLLVDLYVLDADVESWIFQDEVRGISTVSLGTATSTGSVLDEARGQ